MFDEHSENNIIASAFDDMAFDEFLNNRDFEKAIDWINLLGDFSELSYEEKLINALMLDDKQIEAERFIFGKIKKCKDLLIVIRQIRNLSKINPLMSRMFIGNMPAKPQDINLKEYYTHFAIAQSRMGMINDSEITLGNIEKTEVKIIYLGNLLDTYYPKSETQSEILNSALFLLEKIPDNEEKKNNLFILLSKGARTILQNELSMKLFESAQNLSS